MARATRISARDIAPGPLGPTQSARQVGLALAEQRRALGLTVADVSQRLRIRRPYLEAIEAGRFEKLPGTAYVPAFVRTYAGHIGLDPAPLLEAWRAGRELEVGAACRS